MDAVLKSVLAGQTENYLLPFFWLHEGHDAELPTQIQKIAESGCRAFCVESRPYEHFCEEAWWKTMNIVLREAQKRQMRVWILDDKHFQQAMQTAFWHTANRVCGEGFCGNFM